MSQLRPEHALKELALRQGVEAAHEVAWHHIPGAGALCCPVIVVSCPGCRERERLQVISGEYWDRPIPIQFTHYIVQMRRHRRRCGSVEDWYWFGCCRACGEVAWTVLFNAVNEASVQPDAVVKV